MSFEKGIMIARKKLYNKVTYKDRGLKIFHLIS